MQQTINNTLLYRETSAKDSVALTENDGNTQTFNTGNAPPNMGSLPPNTANSATPGARSTTKMLLTIRTM